MLRQIPTISDPNLLVGLASRDDAAVYQISQELALIQTVDFFPPVVDEPHSFGEIAVANAVSDVYAMGGSPLLGLNIVGFPSDLPKDILGAILKGGASKAQEANLLIVGGHTVDDKEPKYGMAVTGIVKPGDQITTSGAQPGDKLVLTKPIGTGIITTAGKHQRVSSPILEEAISVMKTLNHAASDAMVKVGVHACTDVTGFGLIGHLLLMMGNDGCARISMETIPVLNGVSDMLEQDMIPGGTRRNLASAENKVEWTGNIDENSRLLLSDAQTSGGLLISVEENKLKDLLQALKDARVETTAVIGEILEPGSLNGKHIKVTM